jgi:hypothetical protein
VAADTRNESVSGLECSPLEISMGPVGTERHGCGNKFGIVRAPRAQPALDIAKYLGNRVVRRLKRTVG